MPNEVITTDQLKYSRLVAKNDKRTTDRWLKCFSWFPGRQNIEYGRVAQIYCESRHRYGEDLFLKYARQKRLNKKHTFSQADPVVVPEKEEDEGLNDDVNSDAKVPPTTNGEYGRFKPTRMHYC